MIVRAEFYSRLREIVGVSTLEISLLDNAQVGDLVRQLLSEYAPDAKVWTADSKFPKKIKEFTVRELLPAAFLDVPS